MFICNLVSVADIQTIGHGISFNCCMSSNAAQYSGIQPKIVCAPSIDIIETVAGITFNEQNCSAEPDDEAVVGAPYRYSGVQKGSLGTSLVLPLKT